MIHAVPKPSALAARHRLKQAAPHERICSHSGAAGFGVTRVLSYQASNALTNQSLVRLLHEHEPADVPIHVVYPSGRHPPPKLRAFLDFMVPRLRERLGDLPKGVAAPGRAKARPS